MVEWLTSITKPTSGMSRRADRAWSGAVFSDLPSTITELAEMHAGQSSQPQGDLPPTSGAMAFPSPLNGTETDPTRLPWLTESPAAPLELKGGWFQPSSVSLGSALRAPSLLSLG